MRPALFACLLPALAAVPACTDDLPTEPAAPIVTTGTYRHFVQTGWNLPASSAEARDLGFDLDDDGTIDNQAGAVVGALDQIGLDLTGAAAEAFGGGGLVLLHAVRADSLADDPSVVWRVLHGAPTLEPPRFDGTDALRVASSDGELLGEIRGGRAELTWGVVTLPVPFFPDQPPLQMPMSAARMHATITDNGCTGKVGGVILAADRDLTLRRLAAETVRHIEAHPEHEFTVTALQIFDADHDGRLTVDELVASSLVQGLLAPDVDVDHDGANDGLSFAVGFDCVPATFTVVGE